MKLEELKVLRKGSYPFLFMSLTRSAAILMPLIFELSFLMSRADLTENIN